MSKKFAKSIEELSGLGQDIATSTLNQFGYDKAFKKNQKPTDLFLAPAKGAANMAVKGAQSVARFPLEIGQEVVSGLKGKGAKAAKITSPTAQKILGTKEIVPPSVEGARLAREKGPLAGATAFALDKVSQALGFAGSIEAMASAGHQLLQPKLSDTARTIQAETQEGFLKNVKSASDPRTGSGFDNATYREMTGRDMIGPNGTIDPELAIHRIQDVAQHLELRQKGLGDMLQRAVDPGKVTPQELYDKAAYIAAHHAAPEMGASLYGTVLKAAQQLDSKFPGKQVGARLLQDVVGQNMTMDQINQRVSELTKAVSGQGKYMTGSNVSNYRPSSPLESKP